MATIPHKDILSGQYISSFFSPTFSFIPEGESKEENNETIETVDNGIKFEIGKIYSLKGVECDDFKMPSKEYRLKAIVSTVNEVTIDSLVMKQINGDKGTIFSLTKSDCRLLGIEFEPCLQLFPKNMNWEEVKEEDENNVEEVVKLEEETKNNYDIFDENDLSTYPVCFVDGTIRHLIVKISGCYYNYRENKLELPNGIELKSSSIVDNINVISNMPICGDNIISSNIKYNTKLSYKIITNKVSRCVTNNLVDDEGNMFLEIDFFNSRLRRTSLKSDGMIGIQPLKLKNKNINEIIRIEILTFKETKRKIDYPQISEPIRVSYLPYLSKFENINRQFTEYDDDYLEFKAMQDNVFDILDKHIVPSEKFKKYYIDATR